jgi:CheY-like chemotaxis protein
MHLPEAATRPRVLIVDDDHVMRMLEEETLAQFDFEVSIAADGEEAIELLAGHLLRWSCSTSTCRESTALPFVDTFANAGT